MPSQKRSRCCAELQIQLQSVRFAAKFVSIWKNLNPKDEIVYRNLSQSSIPHVTEEWIAADFTHPAALTSEAQEVLKFSNQLVDDDIGAGLTQGTFGQTGA